MIRSGRPSAPNVAFWAAAAQQVGFVVSHHL